MRPLVEQSWFGRVMAPLGVGVLILGVWQWACVHWDIPPYLFPAPTAIAHAATNDWPQLLSGLWSTMRITLVALTGAVVLGTLIAFVFVQSKLIELSLLPYVIIMQVTPLVAIVPLIIILLKDTGRAMTLCATIIAIFPIISNTTIGLRSVDPGLASYFRMNKAGRWATLTRLQIPGALPFFLAGLRISSGLALVGAVVAEFVAGTGGVGSGLAYEIMQSSFQLDIPRMFVALGLISAAGVTMFVLVVWLQQALLGRWHESAMKQER